MRPDDRDVNASVDVGSNRDDGNYTSAHDALYAANYIALGVVDDLIGSCSVRQTGPSRAAHGCDQSGT